MGENKQLEFSFVFPKKSVDYEKLYEELQWRPLTFREIREMFDLTVNQTAQVITTLTLKYPIWSPSKGAYKLLDDTDF